VIGEHLMADLALPGPTVDVLAQRKAGLSDVASVQTREQARHVAEQFERMFIAEMLGPMFAGIETDGRSAAAMRNQPSGPC